jgi:hypothetical protein
VGLTTFNASNPIRIFISVGLDVQVFQNLARNISDWNRKSQPKIEVVQSLNEATFVVARIVIPEQTRSQAPPAPSGPPLFTSGCPISIPPADYQRCLREESAARAAQRVEVAPVYGYIIEKADSGGLTIIYRYFNFTPLQSTPESGAVLANALFDIVGRSTTVAPPPKPAAAQPSATPELMPPATKPDSTPATIWLYRPKSLTDSSFNPTIYSRGSALAKLEKGQFFALSVPPGTYYFSFTDNPKPGQEAWVTVASGQRAFFKVRYRQIKPVGPDEAAKDFRSLRPIEGSNVRNSGVLAKGPFD